MEFQEILETYGVKFKDLRRGEVFVWNEHQGPWIKSGNVGGTEIGGTTYNRLIFGPSQLVLRMETYKFYSVTSGPCGEPVWTVKGKL